MEVYDPASIWAQIMNSLEPQAIPLKGGKAVMFKRVNDTTVAAVGRNVPSITRRDIERALPFWPTPRVSDLPDTGTTSYIWALLRHATRALEPQPAEAREPLEEIRALAGELQETELRLHTKIRAAAEEDLSLRQIGEAAGISHQTVARIVSEEA